MTPKVQQSIISSADKVSEDCDYSAGSNFTLGNHWDKWNLRLGLSAAILSALAAISVDKLHGVIGDQAAQMLTSFVAFLAAIAASVLTFLKPSEKASVYREFGNKYRALRNRSRVFASIDCNVKTEYDELRRGLDELLKEKADLNLDNPVIPEWAYLEAKRLVETKRREAKARRAEEQAAKEKASAGISSSTGSSA
jgi:hypothetical protein